MDKYHKELRDKFELETKTHHDLIGEHHLPSWDYVFWLEDFIHQLQNTTHNSDYTKCQELLKECFDSIGARNLITKPIYEKLLRHFA
jgi:hypothetical protein